jgi:hypothetical protein
MQFESSKEFAHYIKAREHEYAAEAEDIEERLDVLRKRYPREIEESGVNLPKEYTPTKTKYEDAVYDLVQEFYETLTVSVRDKFLNRFYFTTIDNRYARANIRRSNDGKFYGVFVNSNLITGFHKLGKLQISIFFPQAVDSCSRYPGQKVSRKQMIEIYSEVYLHFSETKIALGPLVILREPFNRAHLYNLKLQEQLIIFHEIGHFLNGDLESNQENREVFDGYQNASHQREHLADVIGFGLLLRQLEYHKLLDIRMRYTLLLAVINVYKVLYILQGIETEDYPHPLDRMATFIANFYGKETEEWVSNAIINNKTYTLTFETMPTIVGDELSILKYIEDRLQKAFDEPVEDYK